MSTEIPSPSIPTIDPYKHLQITLNPDGSITRNPNRFQNTPANPDPCPRTSVLSKDIPINASKVTWMRLFLPRSALDHNASSMVNKKLPLVIYFHGGGFIHCSAGNTIFHQFCSDIAGEISVVVASVEYRLAPEHRLPAAYDDAMEALYSVGATSEEWLIRYADLSTSYLMGTSAGSNIAYHVGLRLAESHCDLAPVRIRGLILHNTFFGGTQRTESECRVVNDALLPPGVSDLLWELSLPVGADRDHGYCNPTTKGGSTVLDKIRAVGWRYLITGCRGDPLIDRQVAVARLLEGRGVSVESHFVDGGFHGLELMDASKRKALLHLVRNFISRLSHA